MGDGEKGKSHTQTLKRLIILLQFLLSFGIYYNPQKLFSEERQLHWFKFITVMIRKSFSPFGFFRANKALDLLLVVISVQFSCSIVSDLSFPICFSGFVFSFCPLNVDVAHDPLLDYIFFLIWVLSLVTPTIFTV